MTPIDKRGLRKRRWMPRAVIGGLAFSFASLAYVGWSWNANRLIDRIEVSGAVHADSSDVVRFAGLESDSVGLSAVAPDVLLDRIRRAPWVRDATIRRRAWGTVSIRLEEREPVALVMTPDGRPAYYLDKEGYELPLVQGAIYDVPLLRGRIPTHTPTQPIESPPVLELLQAIADADAETNALLSEIVLDAGGNALLRTSPAGERGSQTVRLGMGNYVEKLARLHAFWHSAVLTRPEINYQYIDMRFDGQIVTVEDTTHASQIIHLPQPQLP